MLATRPSSWKTWIAGVALLVLLHWAMKLAAQIHHPQWIADMQALSDKVMWVLTVSLLGAVITWSWSALRKCRDWLKNRVKIGFTLILGQDAVKKLQDRNEIKEDQAPEGINASTEPPKPKSAAGKRAR